MKLAAEYHQHAQECRRLARGMPEGYARDQLLRMAETWENLAKDRETQAPAWPREAPKAPPKK